MALSAPKLRLYSAVRPILFSIVFEFITRSTAFCFQLFCFVFLYYVMHALCEPTSTWHCPRALTRTAPPRGTRDTAARSRAHGRRCTSISYCMACDTSCNTGKTRGPRCHAYRARGLDLRRGVVVVIFCTCACSVPPPEDGCPDPHLKFGADVLCMLWP